jgi:CDGSH-type Zn-finger protein
MAQGEIDAPARSGVAVNTEPSIRAYPAGPLVVRGRVKVVGEDGEEVADRRLIALCRCGRSRRQPLCDGLHAAGRQKEVESLVCSRRAPNERG